MKKIISAILVIAVAVLFSANVFASTVSEKKRLINKLENFEFDVEDTTLCFNEEYINKVKDYLDNEYDGEIKSASVDNALKDLNALTGIIKASAAYADTKTLMDIKKLKPTDRDIIISYGNDAVKDFGLCIVYDESKDKIEYFGLKDSSVKFESDGTFVKKVSSNSYTAVMVAIMALAVAVFFGTVIVVKKYAVAKSANKRK